MEASASSPDDKLPSCWVRTPMPLGNVPDLALVIKAHLLTAIHTPQHKQTQLVFEAWNGMAQFLAICIVDYEGPADVRVKTSWMRDLPRQLGLLSLVTKVLSLR